jgi:hypothetical protein
MGSKPRRGRKGGKKDRPKAKAPKVNKYGMAKQKKGEWKHGMMLKYNTRLTKGGKVRAVGDRKCAIHAKCDCLKKANFDGMSQVYNR